MADGQMKIRMEIVPNKPAHIICLQLRVTDPEQWAVLWEKLSIMADEQREHVQEVLLSSSDASIKDVFVMDEDPREFHDETLNVITKVLQRCISGVTPNVIAMIIREMHKSGLEFRLRG